MAGPISKTRRKGTVTIVVDGNDGTGKSTLVASLRGLGFSVKDRGIPSLMTDGKIVKFPENEIYIILDAPVAVCRKRLKYAGKNLEEKYHTISDLKYYRDRFSQISKVIPRSSVIDARGGVGDVLGRTLGSIKKILTCTKASD